MNHLGTKILETDRLVLKLSCPVTKLISMLVSKLLLRLSCENYVVRGSCYLPRTLY